MAHIAGATIQALNDRLDAAAVVGDYVRLEKRGGQYWGCCPFHNEKTPSFKVDPSRKLYYCFGCHKGGSIIDFVMEMDKLSFPEAVEDLAKKSGVEIIYDSSHSREQERDIAARKDELYELYRRVAGTFSHILLERPQGEDARTYLAERKINREMVERFRMGFAPKDRLWLFNFLSEKGYSETFLAESKLFSSKYPRWAFFSNRLMFPIADRQGRFVAFGGRILPSIGALGEDGGRNPKYINSLESDIYKKGQTLFAVDLALPEIRRTKEVCVAEGYMDVVALHQAGVSNAVAPLGTAFTDDQAKLLRRWAERVKLIFDADEAGQNAAVKAILTCRRNGLAASVVVPGDKPPPDYLPARGGEGGMSEDFKTEAVFKDPADILKKFGPEALRKSIEYVILDFEYLLRRGKNLFDVTTSEGKARAAAYLFPYLETLDSEVSRDTFVGEIADALGIERQAVLTDYRRAGTIRTGVDRERAPEFEGGVSNGRGSIRMNDELFLLASVLANHELVIKLRSTLSIEEIEDPRAKELFIALEEWFRNDMPGIDDLLSRIHDEALRNFVLEQSVSKAFSINPEMLLDDGIKRVKRKRLERRQSEIVIELRTQKRGESGRSLEDLLAEKVHIDAEMRKFKEVNP
ncbi:MAG: DNA primase [Treponema sp.]|jgi:DNA primase|nr:DNA primase [Treponema sp.]